MTQAPMGYRDADGRPPGNALVVHLTDAQVHSALVHETLRRLEIQEPVHTVSLVLAMDDHRFEARIVIWAEPSLPDEVKWT